ncbi:MAG: ATPase, T2SS/T4P/T4SS family [Candidatus Altiarchaeota archaeon]
MEDKKKELIDLVKSLGRVNLDELSERLKVDKKELYVWAEELRKKDIVGIEPHFLKAPDLVATDKLRKAKRLPGVDDEDKEDDSKESSKPAPQEPVKVESGKLQEPPADKTPLKEPGAPTPLKDSQKPQGLFKPIPKKVEPEKKPSKQSPEGVEIESYTVSMGKMNLPVRILDADDYVYHYNIEVPKIDFVTRALLDETKRSLVGEIQIETHTIMDSEKFNMLKTKFFNRACDKLKLVLKRATPDYIETLARVLVNEMIGLGEIEYLLADKRLEEVVVNSSRDVIWIYHKKFGWVKTNLMIPTEEMILNYSSRIAREIGREITHLEPLLDAHLATGDRVNATLFPVSSFGNTITIRRFTRTPWTMIHMMDPKVCTISPEAAAFLWLAVEYEFSMLVAGGTASGKTTMLNALMPFMPANHRILTMEDTRELNLPKYLHWVPLTIRPPNPHGEGEISMLDLIQNALRMRPDRIIVGEVRRKRETEVLFEAMHTGHSVYGTFHAEQAYEVVDRITTPPMDIPPTVFSSLHLIVVQYRNRRSGARRTFEIAELTKGGDKPELNTLFRWNSKTDKIEQVYSSVRIKDELELFAGMSEQEMIEDLNGKKLILEWLLKNRVRSVNDVGRIIAHYYLDKEKVLDLVKKGKPPEKPEEADEES